MSAKFHFRLVTGPVDGAWARAQVQGPDAGCSLVFFGTARERARDGRRVLRLEYEAYASMAAAEMQRIADEVLAGRAVLRAALEHAVGVVPIGAASVALALAAAHRADVFAAASDLMNELKARAPIWKREVYEDGSAWLGRGS
jgi:molybdopterin synthase catalytic subunit